MIISKKKISRLYVKNLLNTLILNRLEYFFQQMMPSWTFFTVVEKTQQENLGEKQFPRLRVRQKKIGKKALPAVDCSTSFLRHFLNEAS